MKKIAPFLVVTLILFGVSFMPTFAQEVAIDTAQDTTIEIDTGITPDSPFYFIDSFWKSVRLTFIFNPVKKVERRMEFARERLAEAEEMGKENKIEAMQKALERYGEQIEKAKEKVQKKSKRQAEIAERVAEGTAKHIEILERVRENVPEQVKEALLRAREKSERGHLEAIRALSGEQAEKAAEFTAKALDLRIKLAEKLSDKKDKLVEKEMERFERFAEFAEELRAKFKDKPELHERVKIHLEEGMLQREITLRRILDKVPVLVRPAIEKALDKNERIQNPRLIDIIIDEKKSLTPKLPIDLSIERPRPPTDFINDDFRPQNLRYEIQEKGILIKWDYPKEKGEIIGYRIATSGFGGFVWRDVGKVSQTSYLLTDNKSKNDCFLKVRVMPINKKGKLLTYSAAHLLNIDLGDDYDCGPVVDIFPPIIILDPKSDNKVVSILCSQKPKVGNLVNVYSSTNGKYYALNYSYRVFGDPRDMKTNGKIYINPVLDNPSAYYDSSGNSIGYCGGLLNEVGASFCTEVLPALSFNTTDLCI